MSDNHVDGVLLRALAEIIGLVSRKHSVAITSDDVDATLTVSPTKKPPPAREIEDSILQALEDKTMFAKEIAKEAGYADSRHFRDALRKLESEGRITKGASGYTRNNQP